MTIDGLSTHLVQPGLKTTRKGDLHGKQQNRYRSDHADRRSSQDRGPSHGRGRYGRLELGHAFSRHRNHPEGPGPGGCLAVHAAAVRGLHLRPRRDIGARRGERRPRDHSRQRPGRAQPPDGRTLPARSPGALLPPVRAGLGGHRQCPAGRPGPDRRARQTDFTGGDGGRFHRRAGPA
jgi:hypothetical protein